MSGHQRDSERIFTWQELGEPLGALPSGVLLLHDDCRPAGSRDLGQRGGRGLCLVAAEAQALAEIGLWGVARSGSAGVVLHAGGDADPARLALVFGLHLGVRRSRDPRPVRPCATSMGSPPLPGDHLVRLPHLIAVRLLSGAIEARTIWEVMTTDNARAWLGGPLPETEKRLLIEQRLPALLALRGQARAGRLPHTDTGRRLTGLLVKRYLSIRMVYQHIDLFLALLDEQALRRLA